MSSIFSFNNLNIINPNLFDLFFFHIILIFKILILIIFILINVAYLTLLERKVLGAIHRRIGPNVVGVFGLLQPLADGLKLFVKENIQPSSANKTIFLIAPMISFFISLLTWAAISFNSYFTFSNINLGALYILAVGSLGTYGILMGGWSSNSKYAFLGGLRSTAQMVSYELSLGFIVGTLSLVSGSFNIFVIIESQKYMWFIIPFFILGVTFFIAGLAETNRHPFDLPEAEAELVSGYNVEYSGMSFAMYSLAEYSNILLMSTLNAIFFFGGWQAGILSSYIFFESLVLAFKIVTVAILFIYMRALLPRYRYDQLMSLGWKSFLPIAITYFFLTFIFMNIFNLLPY